MEEFNFGENLRKIRILKGIKQEPMASDLGMTQGNYSKIEKLSKRPEDEDLLQKIADYLGVSVEMLETRGSIKVKKTMTASRLRMVGRILYALLLAAAVYDFTRGFSDGMQLESPYAIAFVGLLVTLIAAWIWKVTLGIFKLKTRALLE